ncbi:hypothetical protein AK812_SmicGene19533 [Symbiodinium microadriaticum]|uniref:Uncharacterized protein n=1 Tax=Symbiodinium microadriaticum TaxID=2951 RepID=A0A1Q9DS96_SYMMI|nr:hypothetical protein AK812_SmicGene19533 [Symbiodinium microadriaticum]
MGALGSMPQAPARAAWPLLDCLGLILSACLAFEQAPPPKICAITAMAVEAPGIEPGLTSWRLGAPKAPDNAQDLSKGVGILMAACVEEVPHLLLPNLGWETPRDRADTKGASSFAAKYKTQPKNLLALAFGISFRTMRLGGGGAKAGVWQVQLPAKRVVRVEGIKMYIAFIPTSALWIIRLVSDAPTSLNDADGVAFWLLTTLGAPRKDLVRPLWRSGGSIDSPVELLAASSAESAAPASATGFGWAKLQCSKRAHALGNQYEQVPFKVNFLGTKTNGGGRVMVPFKVLDFLVADDKELAAASYAAFVLHDTWSASSKQAASGAAGNPSFRMKLAILDGIDKVEFPDKLKGGDVEVPTLLTSPPVRNSGAGW